MSERSVPARGILFADAALLTAAAFGVTSAVEGVLFRLIERGLPADVVEGIGSTVGFLGTLLFGTLVTWRLHGRRMTWRAALGMFLGLVATVIIAIALIQGVMLGVVRRFAGEGVELWVALAVLVVLAIPVVAVMARAVVRAARDLRASAPVEPLLDRYRLVCAAIVLLLTVAVGVATVLFPAGDMPEALIFALLFAVLGGAMITGAGLLAKPEGPRPGDPRAAEDVDTATGS